MPTKYPTYQLRCTQELYDKLREAGPDAVRFVLQREFCNTKEQAVCNTRPGEFVVQSEGVRDVVVQSTGEVVIQGADTADLVLQMDQELSDKRPVVIQSKEPAWKAKLEASKARIGRVGK